MRRQDKNKDDEAEEMYAHEEEWINDVEEGYEEEWMDDDEYSEGDDQDNVQCYTNHTARGDDLRCTEEEIEWDPTPSYSDNDYEMVIFHHGEQRPVTCDPIGAEEDNHRRDVMDGFVYDQHRLPKKGDRILLYDDRALKWKMTTIDSDKIRYYRKTGSYFNYIADDGSVGGQYLDEGRHWSHMDVEDEQHIIIDELPIPVIMTQVDGGVTPDSLSSEDQSAGSMEDFSDGGEFFDDSYDDQPSVIGEDESDIVIRQLLESIGSDGDSDNGEVPAGQWAGDPSAASFPTGDLSLPLRPGRVRTLSHSAPELGQESREVRGWRALKDEIIDFVRERLGRR